MKPPKELCNSELTQLTFVDVMFLSFTEGGAMGEPGAILFFVKGGEFYHLNYVYGDVDLKKVKELFPVPGECEFAMFGTGSIVPKGWKYVDLGKGNHLIVNDEVYNLLKKELGDVKSPPEVYGKWIEVAEEVLCKTY